MYEMVTGEQPFGAPNSTEGLKRRILGQAQAAARHRQGCARLVAGDHPALPEPDPAKRYPSASQLASTDQPGPRAPDRSRGEDRAGWFKVWRRMKFKPIPKALTTHAPEGVNSAPIVMAAVDLSPGHEALAEAVLEQFDRIDHRAGIAPRLCQCPQNLAVVGRRVG